MDLAGLDFHAPELSLKTRHCLTIIQQSSAQCKGLAGIGSTSLAVEVLASVWTATWSIRQCEL